jgi:hypothetical protein
MDPLSISAAAAGLLTFAAAIYKCVESIRGADETLMQLKSEVFALQSGLKSIESIFKSDEVGQLYDEKSNDKLRSNKLLVELVPLLHDCKTTLKKLAAMLDGIDGKPGQASIVSKPARALKLNLKSSDIELIRQQIRSYTSAMHLTLQVVNL